MIRQSTTLRLAEKSSLEAGRKALIRLVATYKKKRNHKTTIVFDGWESGSPDEERDLLSGVNVIYSKLGEKADDVIKRMAQLKKEEIVVVTSDRDIIHYVEHRQSAVISPADFEKRIETAARGARQAAMENKDDDSSSARSSHKKGPARRLSKKKKADLVRLRKL